MIERKTFKRSGDVIEVNRVIFSWMVKEKKKVFWKENTI
jgi:hypothetical protein